MSTSTYSGTAESGQQVVAPEHIAYVLKWTAGARPPAHPRPMDGRQSFGSLLAVKLFWDQQAADAVFVSLEEVRTVTTDLSGLFKQVELL